MSADDVTAGLHKAVPADNRLEESSCTVCGDLVRRTIGGQGVTWAHSDGHIVSSRRPLAEHAAQVTVWANGFGVWHVRVPRHAVAPLIAARRALRDELTAREANVSRDVWMHPVEVPELSDADTIVYRENTDSGCSCGQADKGAPGHETH